MNCIAVYLLIISLIWNPCDSSETKNLMKNDLKDSATKSDDEKGNATASNFNESDNEIPTINHESASINQYQSPPLCYQVQYAEMAENPKIICGKELQQIYLKFNPGLMKNLFVNIYLTNEDNPITIKPIESLNAIYNDTSSPPYFEPPINPEHAEKLTSLEASSRQAEGSPPPSRTVYYYPEAQKYPANQETRRKVTIGSPNSDQFTYEKDDAIYFNRRDSPFSFTQYDPYAYRNIQPEVGDQLTDNSKNIPVLWDKMFNSNKPLVLNCFINPISCPSNTRGFPQAQGNSGISTNNFHLSDNNVGFEDYEETTNSVQRPFSTTQNDPYYNYQDLQKKLFSKRPSDLNIIQNGYSNSRELSYSPREATFHTNLPSPAQYAPSNFNTVSQSRQFSEYPSSCDHQNVHNLREPNFNHYFSRHTIPQNPFQPEGSQESGGLMRNGLTPSQPNGPSIRAPYLADTFQFPASRPTTTRFYTVSRRPVIRMYYKRPIMLPIITAQQLYNEKKSLPNMQVLLGFIQPTSASYDGPDNSLNVKRPTLSNINTSLDPTAENKWDTANVNSFSKTTEPALSNKDNVVSVTESSTTVKSLTLGDTGPEISSAPEVGNQKEEHVQKKPAAFPSDENPGSAIQQNNLIHDKGNPDGSSKTYKQNDDDISSENILKDYILNMKNRERQYEKVLLQSQRQIEELQYNFEQLKKGVGKYSRPSTPYYNYGVNNNNNPLQPSVPIVQHFTSLNSPLIPSASPFYPAAINYPLNMQRQRPIDYYSRPPLQPGNVAPDEKSDLYSEYFGKHAKGKEIGGIHMDTFNNLGTYVNPALPHHVGEYVYRMPVSSNADDDFIDYQDESDPKMNSGIVNNNLNLREKNINFSSTAKPNSIVDAGVETTTEKDKTSISSSTTFPEIPDAFSTHDAGTANTSSSRNANMMPNRTLTPDTETKGSPSTQSAVTAAVSISDNLLMTSPSSPTENSSDDADLGNTRNVIPAEQSDNINGKKVKTTIVSNLKFVEEISSNRTIYRDSQGDEVIPSTKVSGTNTSSVTSTSTPTVDRVTEIDESPTSTETTDSGSETNADESTSSADDIVGAAFNTEPSTSEKLILVTESSATQKLSPSKNVTSSKTQENSQTSTKSTENSSQNSASNLDPLIEDIVKGIKEKRNYVDDIFENPQKSGIKSNNESSGNKINGKAVVERNQRPPVPPETLALIEAPLTLVYYPAQRNWKYLNKS